MTSIVLKNPVNGHDNGEEIDVNVYSREYEDDREIIETDKGLFSRTLDYSPTDPYGWKEIFPL